MNDKPKKRTKIVLPKLHLDWSDTKPPTRPASEAMLENLHAAAGTEVDHTPNKPDDKNSKTSKI